MTDMPSLDLSNRFDAMANRARSRLTAAANPGPIGRLAVRLNHRLSQPPRVCVMGELNSGKSTLVNVLLGTSVLPTSAAGNTRLPARMFHSDRPSLAIENQDRERFDAGIGEIDPQRLSGATMLHAGLPISRLKTFEIIDTPGLQSGDDELCERAANACRQSHLAIWCTTATQAWKASELGALQSLPQRLRQSGILVITFKDAIGSAHDEGRLWSRINAEAAPHFKKVVMVSARDAISSRQLSDRHNSEQAWHLSGAAELMEAVDTQVSAHIMTRVHGAERLLNSALTAAHPQALRA